MKINKGMSVLLASMLVGSMLVGCNDNSNTDTTEPLTKNVKEVTKDKTETKEATKDKTKDKKVEASEDKEEKAPKDNKESSSKKQVNTKKDNDNSAKEEPKKKDTNTKKDTKEEPKKKGYYVTCPNGHKIYTENGDWDCIECDDDWQEQQDDSNIDEDEEYEPGYIKDGTHLGENNPDESIEVIEDPEYYE